MRIFVIFVVAFFVHNCEATFGSHKSGGGNLALSGNFHGLLGNHGGGAKPSEPAPVDPAPIEPAKPSGESGFSLGGNIHGLLKNHRLLSSGANGGSGFSLGGNVQGLLKNHRLLGALHKKETTTATPIDFGFDGDNEGYSVSTGDVAPEPIEVVPPPAEIPEPIVPVEVVPEPVVTIPESAPQQPATVTGTASFSSSGGHNIHKILG